MSLKKKKNINLLHYMIIIILIAILVFLVFNLLDNIYLDKKEIYASFSASDIMGFDLNSTALTFGFLTPGNSASREIFLENRFEKDLNVKIIVNGEISKFLRISEENFILIPKERKKIGFSIYAPKDILLKKYEGKVIILSRPQ